MTVICREEACSSFSHTEVSDELVDQKIIPRQDAALTMATPALGIALGAGGADKPALLGGRRFVPNISKLAGVGRIGRAGVD